MGKLKRKHSNQDIANYWAGEPCTLDGVPAKVIGRLNKFATIATYDTNSACEFSWFAVKRVMENEGGHFKS